MNKGFLTLKESIYMLKSAGIDIGDKDITFCYAMSKMAVLNESTQSSI